MASGDWATALGAALSQFGSSYKGYRQNEQDKAAEAQRVAQALARQKLDEEQFSFAKDRAAKQDQRQQIQDFRDAAPFEAPLDDAMVQQFNQAGMGALVGNRPATQTNIPSQFLMEGGAAQSVNPGAYLKPSLQQQQQQQQLYAQDPGVRQQLELERERRDQAQWEQRNAIEARQRMAQIAAAQREPRPAEDPFLAAVRSLGPSLIAQGVAPGEVANTIRNMMGQTPQAGAPASTEGYPPDLQQHLQDMDSDMQIAGGIAPYLNDVRAKVATGELNPQVGDILMQEAISRQRRRRTDISLP